MRRLVLKNIVVVQAVDLRERYPIMYPCGVILHCYLPLFSLDAEMVFFFEPKATYDALPVRRHARGDGKIRETPFHVEVGRNLLFQGLIRILRILNLKVQGF